MDANFRLKNQLILNYSQDPGLGIGWAYMVPRKPYEDYVLVLGSPVRSGFLSRFDKTETETRPPFLKYSKTGTGTVINRSTAVFCSFLRS